MIKGVTALFLSVVLAGCTGAQPSTSLTFRGPTALTVYAAASLQPAFDRLATLAVERRIASPNLHYGGTQSLVRELIAGASGDVFASADTTYMNTLKSAGLLDGAARVFAHNSLEIVVQKGNPKHIQSLADLARPGLVVVLADPSVPAGKYAQEALSKAHVAVHPASLELQVTGVLTKVRLGDADVGIVYVSDVATQGYASGVNIPDDQNVIADYPIAALNPASNRSGARAFIDLILSPEGQAIMKWAGFKAA
ncbi:MAG: molybdate ABC transporter substrate-binding protein [Candidatus Dormibacteraceae bacterium]